MTKPVKPIDRHPINHIIKISGALKATINLINHEALIGDINRIRDGIIKNLDKKRCITCLGNSKIDLTNNLIKRMGECHNNNLTKC